MATLRVKDGGAMLQNPKEDGSAERCHPLLGFGLS
jgi:hypothetical protein